MKKLKGFDIIYVPSTRIFENKGGLSEAFVTLDMISRKVHKSKQRESIHAPTHAILDTAQLIYAIKMKTGVFSRTRKFLKFKYPIIMHDSKDTLDFLKELKHYILVSSVCRNFEMCNRNRNDLIEHATPSRGRRDALLDGLNLYDDKFRKELQRKFKDEFERYGIYMEFNAAPRTSVSNANTLSVWEIESAINDLIDLNNVSDVLKENDFKTEEELVKILNDNKENFDSEIMFVRVNTKQLMDGERDKIIPKVLEQLHSVNFYKDVNEDNVNWFLENYLQTCKTFKKLND